MSYSPLVYLSFWNLFDSPTHGLMVIYVVATQNAARWLSLFNHSYLRVLRLFLRE